MYEFDGTEYDELRDMQATRRAKYLDLVRGGMNFIQSSRMDRPKTRPIAPCPNLDPSPSPTCTMPAAAQGGHRHTHPERRGAGSTAHVSVPCRHPAKSGLDSGMEMLSLPYPMSSSTACCLFAHCDVLLTCRNLESQWILRDV